MITYFPNHNNSSDVIHNSAEVRLLCFPKRKTAFLGSLRSVIPFCKEMKHE